MESHKTYIHRGRTETQGDQAVAKHFNSMLGKCLFGHQYVVEMLLPEGQRSTAWVKRLPDVVSAMNNEVTRLTGKKPAAAIKDKGVMAKPSTPYSRPVGVNEKKNYPPMSMFVIFTNLVNLRVEQKGGQTLSGLESLHA